MPNKLRTYFEQNANNNQMSDTDFFNGVKELICKGADVNFDEGFCLWYVCNNNCRGSAMVELLLQCGTKPDTQKGDALRCAVSKANVLNVELLLKYGANQSWIPRGDILNAMANHRDNMLKIKDLLKKYSTPTNYVQFNLDEVIY